MSGVIEFPMLAALERVQAQPRVQPLVTGSCVIADEALARERERLLEALNDE